MTVLFVEDNIMNQQMAKFSIEKCGAKLEIAHHGQEAVDVRYGEVRSCKPGYDCILMDMMMPIMDGATATTEIRALEQRRRLTSRRPSWDCRQTWDPSTPLGSRRAGMDGKHVQALLPGHAAKHAAERQEGHVQEGFEGEMTCPGDNPPAH